MKLGRAALMIATILLQYVFADQAVRASDSPAPGVEFTKVQDLKPNAPATNRPIKQKWAVVIGASRFKEKRLDNELPKMDAAAKNFYDYLVDENGGRFDLHHVKLLVNDQATRQNIMSDLGSRWLGQLAGPDDLVVVFIATSSFPTTDGSTYLCAYDCALDNVYSTCISMQSLMDTLKRDVHCDRILLVLQSCYSGSAQLTEGSKTLGSTYNVDLRKISLGKGYIILSSSMPDQRTYGDSFSENLIKALHDQNGMVSVREAFDSARSATEKDTLDPKSGKPRQTPMMMADWSGNELVVGALPVDKVSGLPDTVIKGVSAESCYLEATKLMSAHDVKSAIDRYTEAIQIDPNYGDALADLGAALWIQQDYKSAADMYRRAITVNPNDGLFHANYARVLMASGQKEQAKAELERAYELNPKDKEVVVALSQQAMRDSQPERAVALMREAVELYPDSAPLHTFLSYGLAATGSYGDSMKEAREAIRLDPNFVAAHLNAGSCLLHDGDCKSAIAEYEKAVELDGKNSDTYYLLSWAYQKSGDKHQEIAVLKTFLDVCPPGDRRAAPAQKRLQELESSIQH